MILTHSQLALENSLRRIFPAGVVSCWIPDGYGRAKDIIRDNHGTCFGTHPNVPVIGSPIAQQINACDSTAGWLGTGLSIDTSDKKEGTGSLKSTVASPVAGTYYAIRYDPAGSWDWSDKEYALIWVYCDRASTAFRLAVFKIADTLGNYRYWNITFSAGGWTAIKVLLSTGDYNTATPIDLALVDDVAVLPQADDTTPFYFKLDDLRVTAKPSHVNPSVGWVFGGDDYVEIPADKSFDLVDELTIGAWIYSKNTSGFFPIVSKETGSSAATLSYSLYQSSDGTFRGLISDDTVIQLSPTYPIASNTWYRGIFVLDSNKLRFYVNGSEVGTGTARNIDPQSQPTWPVSLGKFGSAYGDGYSVLPFIVKGAWSQQQVENDYLNTKGLFAPRG